MKEGIFVLAEKRFVINGKRFVARAVEEVSFDRDDQSWSIVTMLRIYREGGLVPLVEVTYYPDRKGRWRARWKVEGTRGVGRAAVAAIAKELGIPKRKVCGLFGVASVFNGVRG